MNLAQCFLIAVFVINCHSSQLSKSKTAPENAEDSTQLHVRSLKRAAAAAASSAGKASASANTGGKKSDETTAKADTKGSSGKASAKAQAGEKTTATAPAKPQSNNDDDSEDDSSEDKKGGGLGSIGGGFIGGFLQVLKGLWSLNYISKQAVKALFLHNPFINLWFKLVSIFLPPIPNG